MTTGCGPIAKSQTQPSGNAWKLSLTACSLPVPVMKPWIIASPRARPKKDNLLLVLQHPELPLHNNPDELGARQRVRKRDVRFGPRTQGGVRAWDTFMSLAETTKKLGVSFYEVIHDRSSGTNRIPRLAVLVEKAAKELNLGASWATASSTPSY